LLLVGPPAVLSFERALRKRAMLAGILFFSLVMAWPLAAFAQSSSSQPSSSSSPQSTAEPKTPSQAQPATLDPPPQKEDSLAEAAAKPR